MTITKIRYPAVKDLSSPPGKPRSSQIHTPILTGFKAKKKLEYPVTACPLCHLNNYTRNLYPINHLSKGKKCYFSDFAREEFYCKICECEVIMRTDSSGAISNTWTYSSHLLLE